VGINQGMIYAPSLPSCIDISSVKSCVSESEVTRRREKEELLPYAAGCVSWELSDPPPCIYCILSLSLNNMDSLPWM